MQTLENKRFHYCRTCSRTHRKGERLAICSVCSHHVKQSYDLQIHTNLSLASESVPGQSVNACEDCINTIRQVSKKKEDPWINFMMGYDEY
jgi:hypothetical protein